MGRGLSDLQQAVLRLALRNREEGLPRREADRAARESRARRESLEERGYDLSELPEHPRVTVDLYQYEVMAEHYGFPLRPGRALRTPQGHRTPGGRHFDREACGASRYDVAKVSLTRAVERLERRGLVVRGWGWLALTDRGVKRARVLSANGPGRPLGLADTDSLSANRPRQRDTTDEEDA